MKLLIILAICVIFVSADVWPPVKYQASSPCIDKLKASSSSKHAIQFRSWIFLGGKAWSDKSTAPANEQPSNYKFNISTNPTTTFIVDDKNVNTTDIGIKATDINYKMLNTQETWSVVKNDQNGDVGLVGHLLTETNTLEVQRTKFFACAWYETGSYSSKTWTYESKSCTPFELPEHNANSQGYNVTIDFKGFGASHLYYEYQHVEPSCLPIYMKSVRVNKIVGYSSPKSTEKYTTTFQVKFKNNMNFATTGSNAWGTGFYIIANPTTQTKMDRDVSGIQVSIIEKKKYEATNESGREYWNEQQEADFSGLIARCGKTVQLANKAIELELTVECTSGLLMKFSFAILMTIAGLFMLF